MIEDHLRGTNARTTLSAAAGESVLDAAARLALGGGSMSLESALDHLEIGPVVHACTSAGRTAVIAAPRHCGSPELTGMPSVVPVGVQIEAMAPLPGIVMSQGSLRGMGMLRPCPPAAIQPGVASAELLTWALHEWEGARTYELVWDVMELICLTGSRLLEVDKVFAAKLDPVACASGRIVEAIRARHDDFAGLCRYALGLAEHTCLPPMKPGDGVCPAAVDRAGMTLLWTPPGHSYAVWVGFDELARTPREAISAVDRLVDRAQWLNEAS
ncbi:hypothetical protein [Gephyromycinifex aptenodytis]|uniref:hypothetical protein n=1 Tax=Gephyromycinifex aptenodytis TaxID=2716227 RepID=UPI001446A573|nr:hypothetical protein [Gephyromycinifex aptenodytis]